MGCEVVSRRCRAGVPPKRIGRALVLLFLGLLPAVGGGAMDLQQMLAGAVNADTRLKVLTLALENTLLGIERARLAPGFNLELSTGNLKIGYSLNPDAGDPPWVLSAEPTATALLGRRTETEFYLDVPVAVRFGDGYQPELLVLPEIRLRQPLDRLFGGEKLTAAQKRQNRYAAEKARVELLKRAKEVEALLLGQLLMLVGMDRAVFELQRELELARATLQRTSSLKTYAPGSAQQKQLEFAVTRLQRELELQGERRGKAYRELERIVGQEVDGLPQQLPEPVLQLPDQVAAGRNPDVYLASLAVELEAARLEEQRRPAKPKLHLGGAVSSPYDQDADRRRLNVGGTFEGTFDDFTVATGIGVEVSTGTLFASAGLSWSFKDRKIESLNDREQENNLALSRWNLAAAQEAYRAAREQLSLQIQELGYRRASLQEDRALADLRLSEAARWFEQGLLSAEGLAEPRQELEKLGYAARALQLDALLARSRLEALVAQDGESQ
jgi:hypothetical protein